MVKGWVLREGGHGWGQRRLLSRVGFIRWRNQMIGSDDADGLLLLATI